MAAGIKLSYDTGEKWDNEWESSERMLEVRDENGFVTGYIPVIFRSPSPHQIDEMTDTLEHSSSGLVDE